MANELSIFYTTGATLTARILNRATAAVLGTVSLTEDATGYYTGDFPSAVAGTYDVAYLDSTTVIGAETISWDGSSPTSPSPSPTGSFGTLSQLRARYDSRTLAQLSNDANSTTASDDNQQAALDDATAEIKTAALQGKIYNSDQLDALVASGDVQLVRMCCDIAVKFLSSRRMDALTPTIQSRVTASENMLEALRRGQRVLNIPINRTGETPVIVTMTSLQQSNTGDLTANEFFGGAPSTLTVDGSSG